jgi:hypothetical protein
LLVQFDFDEFREAGFKNLAVSDRGVARRGVGFRGGRYCAKGREEREKRRTVENPEQARTRNGLGPHS